MYRQGDILLTPVEEEQLSADARPLPRDAQGRVVLALGEATGHAHAVATTTTDAELLADPNDVDRRFLRIVGEGLLTHEEHAPIRLPAGLYRVVRQREFAPGTSREVAD